MERGERDSLFTLYSTIIIYHQSKYPTHGQALKARPEQLQPDLEAGPEERQLHTRYDLAKPCPIFGPTLRQTEHVWLS
ncbi:hypothetical protein Pcinc_011676 [Petrolisthes cinctipes]|uniref:Uncharacterized protein n=1 Tax=Petrolisthes cinctipes TaxID=88211 RepID=A0AAE1G0D0_PETCI|nr:hypothetical protein Pcinc_011676 [Petrolisthes cinctipes]